MTSQHFTFKPSSIPPSSFSRAAAALGVIGAVGLLAACGKPAPSEATKTPAVPAPAVAVDPMLVSVPEDQAKNLKTATVEVATVASTQKHPGRIEANERLVSRVGANVTGRVSSVNAEVGDRVSAGQVLAQVTSPELTTSQMTYLRSMATLSLSERAVERARQMIQADVISSAEFQRRESELTIARAESRAAEDQLQLLGLSAASIDRLRSQGRIQPEGGIHARQSGVIVERKVSSGQVVQPGDQLFTIADLSSVWAIGSLPEQTASSVKKGQTVDIEVPALDKTLTGKVVFISDTVQPETRTVAIRTQLDNTNRELKPQMLMSMRIAGNPKKMPVIPESAVVRENDKDHVFLQVGPGSFKLVPVELEVAVDKMRPVASGLPAGAVIVVEGGFHLNNDRIQRLLTNSSAPKKTEAAK